MAKIKKEVTGSILLSIPGTTVDTVQLELECGADVKISGLSRNSSSIEIETNSYFNSDSLKQLIGILNTVLAIQTSREKEENN